MVINRIFLKSAVNFRTKYSFLARFFNKSKTRIMSGTLEQITQNNKRNEEIINSIKHELSAMNGLMLQQKKKKLRDENTILMQKVEAARAQLIALEMSKGKKQIAVPGARNLCTNAPQQTVSAAETGKVERKNMKSENPPKEKKPKKEKPTAAGAATSTSVEPPIDVGRLDMRVGKIIDVGRHPDADSLYVEKIDCGEAQPRTVVSGLVKHVPLEELQNRMVIVMCNLKPAKMRGVLSEAMVMCASGPDKVEVLSPPAQAVPGDLVHCEGYNRQPDAQLNPKKKIFETCAPDLMTNNDLIACYKGAALHVPGKGKIVAKTLQNVNVK